VHHAALVTRGGSRYSTSNVPNCGLPVGPMDGETAIRSDGRVRPLPQHGTCAPSPPPNNPTAAERQVCVWERTTWLDRHRRCPHLHCSPRISERRTHDSAPEPSRLITRRIALTYARYLLSQRKENRHACLCFASLVTFFSASLQQATHSLSNHIIWCLVSSVVTEQSHRPIT
jgi:hypothetical protein